MARYKRNLRHLQSSQPYKRLPPPIPARAYYPLEDQEEEEEDENEDTMSVRSDSENGSTRKGGGEVAEEIKDDPALTRDNIQTLLEGDAEFQGAASFHRAYSEAPNPGLHLAGLGGVGLPLSIRDAEIVKSHCSQAPFGKGERTLVDKKVRDTWEMDADQVTFENPLWPKFVSEVVQEVCQTLGVNLEASKPRCELYKLLLYETGSHFLPHVDTEKEDGMFATIIIVLPSRFTGGTAHLTHGGISAVYDSSANSHYQTSTLAWYTDVTHEIKPITSGYRLALSYNLIHTTQSLRPALSYDPDLIAKLRRVLQTWEDDKGRCEDGPEKLVYLLKHTYSQANLRAGALKGVDAHKVAMLDSVANQIGVRLGLATAQCVQSGMAQDYGRGWSGRPEFEEMETELSITNFVDLQGELITSLLDIDEDIETIPVELADSVECGRAEKEDYEGYQGNYGGQLSRWYRRTVLVLWPSWSNFTVQYGGTGGILRAIAHVKSIETTEATSERTELIDFVLSKGDQHFAAAADAVCEAALRWKSPDLWVRAVQACCTSLGVGVLPEEKVVSALENFGLEAIKDGLQTMLDKDLHNTPRLEFLDRLTSLTAGLFKVTTKATKTAKAKKAAAQRRIKQWVSNQSSRIAQSLKAPEKTEIDLLISIAHNNGGIEFLRDTMLGQIVKLADEEVLQAFAFAVLADPDFAESDAAARDSVVSDLFKAAVKKVRFFQPPVPEHQRYQVRMHDTKPTDYLSIAKSYIGKARELGGEDMVAAVIDRVIDVKGLDPSRVRDYAISVVLPLFQFLASDAQIQTGNQLPSKLRELRRAGVRLFLDSCLVGGYYVSIPREHVVALFDAAFTLDSGDFFVKRVWPLLERIKCHVPTLQCLLYETFNRRAKFVFPDGHSGPSTMDMVLTLAKRFIAQTGLQTVPEILAALDVCMQMHVPILCGEVTKRVMNPRDISPMTTHYIETTLVPLVPKLHSWASQHKQDMDAVLRSIVELWVSKILDTRPPSNPTLENRIDSLSRWTCSCFECTTARKFLTQSDQPRIILSRIGASGRKHAEGQLAVYAHGIATWEQRTRTTPQSLDIFKSAEHCKIAGWRGRQARGVALLDSLSTDGNELRRILGSAYDRIKAALAGRAPLPAAKPSLANTHTSRPSTSTTSRALPRHGLPLRPSAPQAGPSIPLQAGPPNKKRKYTAYNEGGVIDLT